MESVSAVRPLHFPEGDREMKSAVGLVVIWPVARRNVKVIDRVLADLRSRFDVLAQFERAWPVESAELNYERFYCDRPYTGRTLRRLKGTGNFTVVVVQDDEVHFDYREAPQGVEVVNTNFFDAKRKYREWLGLEHAIHISDHEREGSRDIALLLGPDALAKIWSDESLESVGVVDELWGANGWKSVNEALSLLNQAARYVVLNDPKLADRLSVFADDYLACVRALNAATGFPILPKWGGLFSMPVGGVQTEVEIRFVGDGFLPSSLARDMLERREICDGIYMPSAGDIQLLTRYGRKVGLEIGQFAHDASGMAFEALGEARGNGTSVEIVPTVPRDLTVGFDFGGAGYTAPLLRGATRRLRRVTNGLRFHAHVTYIKARNGITDTFPLLGRIRRRSRKLLKKRRSKHATKMKFS